MYDYHIFLKAAEQRIYYLYAFTAPRQYRRRLRDRIETLLVSLVLGVFTAMCAFLYTYYMVPNNVRIMLKMSLVDEVKRMDYYYILICVFTTTLHFFKW